MLSWFHRKKAERSPEWSVQSALQDLLAGKRRDSEVFPELAARQIPWFVAVHPGGPSSALWVDTDSLKAAVVFTDLEAATHFAGKTPVQEAAGYGLLRALQRDGYTGLLVNPGPEQLLFDRTHVRLLFREYALIHARTCSLWAPSRDDSLLAVEMSLGGVMAIPVYLEESDALQASENYGGIAAPVTWEQVRARLREVSADAVLLQHGTPEEVPVSRRQVAGLCADGEPADSLDAVDLALAVTGRHRSTAVQEALARCENIWVIADQDGDIVSIGPVFDIFTSATDAAVLIRRLGLKDKAMPLRVPAPGLCKVMAPRGVPLAVNRGGTANWQGDGRAFSRIASLCHRFGTVG